MFRAEEIDKTSINYREKLKIFNICLLLEKKLFENDVTLKKINQVFTWVLIFVSVNFLTAVISNGENSPPTSFLWCFSQNKLNNKITAKIFETTLTPTHNHPSIAEPSFPNTPILLIFPSKCFRIDINSSEWNIIFSFKKKA